MSRARVHEVSSPISLFPFIGILLCTMGALLVVLVAVSRSARNTAERQVQATAHAKTQAADGGVDKKLEQVKQYVGSLNAVRGQAESKLRDEQLRLSHLEDHIRRLHEKMQSLESAAIELNAMEKEHYDDREQAEREITRLHQLIGESQKTIQSLQEAGNKEPRSYAVVPYEGPNGTFRKPIYVECVKNQLVIQPEGVRLTVDDLHPPFGPGNPLASVLRASRDHLVRMNPGAGQSRDTEPYPLLLVRPDGLLVFDRARQAIEAGDFDLGFELVESDWKVKYPQADPQLAGVQQQALDQARARQELLAAAAPRAYRNSSLAAEGEFDFDDGPGGGGSGGGGPGLGGAGGGSGGGSGGGPGGGIGGGSAKTYVIRSDRRADDEESADGTEGGGDSRGDRVAANGNHGAPGVALEGGGASPAGGRYDAGNGPAQNAGADGPGAGNAQSIPNGAPGTSGAFGGGSSGSSPGGNVADKNLVPDGYETQQGASVVAGSQGPPAADQPNAAADSRAEKARINQIESRGKDWALRDKPARSIPVRRTIRVTVRNDQLAIVPDTAPVTAAANGKIIPVRGDTVQSLDEFVKQVHEQIDGWGIAGNGLYWRPVIVLTVGPDGQKRASDLTRLLKNSGLEIRTEETAKNLPQGLSHETR